jgi:hypothetical protein
LGSSVLKKQPGGKTQEREGVRMCTAEHREELQLLSHLRGSAGTLQEVRTEIFFPRKAENQPLKEAGSSQGKTGSRTWEGQKTPWVG